MIRALSIVVSLLIPSLVLADATLSYSDRTTFLVRQGAVLMSSEGSDVLYSNGRQELTMIEHARKRYIVFDDATARQLQSQRSQMDAQMAQMKQQLAQLPPEQRAMAEQMMRQQMPHLMSETPRAKPSIRKGSSTKVGQWTCRNVTVVEGGRPSQELCVAPARAIGISEADYASLLAAMKAIRAMAGRAGGPDRFAAGLEALGGVPVRSKDLGTNRVSELESVSNAALGAARFKVPPGYRRESLTR